MDELIEQLVLQVQQCWHDTEERQKALRELADGILRSRPIARPIKGQPLSGVYLDIFQAIQQQLQQDIDQAIDRYNPRRIPVPEWANGLRSSALQKVLDNSYLTQLALEAQRHKPQTQQGQYAIGELLNAIRLSGKLAHKSQAAADAYEDAVSRTLLWVCQNIHTYNPSKGKFMAWVNYRLDMILKEIHQEYKDPFIQSIEARIIRQKYHLTALIKRTRAADLLAWLRLQLKGLISDIVVSANVIFSLVVLLFLSQFIAQNPTLGDALLFQISQQSMPVSSRKQELSQESNTLEDIPQPEEKPFLSEMVRQYIEEDPARLFQKHIREHPQATFQAIALARINGKTWKEMSEYFGVGIPALNNFFQRRLKEVAPEIRKYIQE
ncbi:MAG TPA: hypothetical protein DDZ80_08810 [Cyanobacteria bacterium UBA8803]|nr:hypothetical protein [Cyanobacteria bacterium UBA9273]HBL58601.1 hypothetical protein [Cyanobacteria bacterium UBA8803]